MNRENGNISIHTENIFPIIKKWLYSDRDIFIRELISNGCDAVSKFKRLISIGEYKTDEELNYKIIVTLNKDNKTIKFQDNGIGMTAEEVKKYINQVAFSGAEDFIARYKDKMDEGNDIIGHFGLGFYSAFMVSELVEIDTLSYTEGAEAVKWKCTGGTEYEINSSELKERGTIITLHMNEESLEFLEEYKLREIIKKYCSFLPVEIYLVNEDSKNKDEKDDISKEPLNDIRPLWAKNPNECTDEEYKDFYKNVFNDYVDPLFWIHLNVDYPFNLKGILYFPKLKNEMEINEGVIKLYNNQVFVADNIKEIIPEFLLLLKGAIDCPDLPLNVSRSFLQKDSNVVKISKHISKKVADKLTELFNKEREKYNNFWDDINPFIKYGCLKDDSFYDKVKDIIIFKTINGEYTTLANYIENSPDKNDKKVFYVTDEKQQSQYINLFKTQKLDALILTSPIDPHFISFLEMKQDGVKFNRIDSDISNTLKAADDVINETENKNTKENLEKLFKEALKNDKIKIDIQSLKTEELPAIMLLSEQSRRMQEMSILYGGKDMFNMFKDEETLVLNKNNKLITLLLLLNGKDDKKDDINMICEQVYDLAMLSHKQLDAEAMSKFIERSNKILYKIATI